MRLGALLLISLSLDSCIGCSPTAPTSGEVSIERWDCERLLTHPVRQTYVRRCVNQATGEVEIRDDD